jgi:hypothetical protein
VIALALMAGLILQFGWQIALYVVLILVALLSAVAIGAIALLILEVLALVRQVRAEIRPLVEQAQQTVKTVQGTTEFVSTGLVKPAIQTASIAAGVMRTISVLRSGVIHPRDRTAAGDTMVKREQYVVRPGGATVERTERVVRPGDRTVERAEPVVGSAGGRRERSKSGR